MVRSPLIMPRRHGVPCSYDHAEALLADKEVDAVYIAYPAGHARAVCVAGRRRW